MPKNTFFNLPKEKKDKIVEVAINEFVEYPYHKASITRIVNSAEIAKGSFYQYFKDKKDLYKYIIELGVEKKFEYLSGTINNIEHMNFFQTIRDIYISGIKFTIDNPKLGIIGDRFIKSQDEELKKEIYGENELKSNTLFEELLKKGIEKKEVKKDINIQLVAVMLTSLSISIGEYFIKEVREKDDIEMVQLIDDMLSVFRDGIEQKIIIKPTKSIEDRFY